MADRAVDFLRLGNPWLVGRNTNRIVPLYVLHNMAVHCADTSERLASILALARGSEPPVSAFPCFSRLTPSQPVLATVQRTCFGVLSPDRRVFRNSKTGGAFGAVTPLLGTLAERTPADDGLGGRLHVLLRSGRCFCSSSRARTSRSQAPGQPRWASCRAASR